MSWRRYLKGEGIWKVHAQSRIILDPQGEVLRRTTIINLLHKGISKPIKIRYQYV